jgi:acyl dehydratase
MVNKSVETLLQFMQPQLGKEIHVGQWLEIDQDRINQFASVTGDEQWIHVDPERAANESPYKATVAHGFLTLSLLPYLTQSNHPDYFKQNYPGMKYRVNMGVNKVRFPAPVIVGSKIRARTTLQSAEPAGEAVQVIYKFTVEVEGKEKPACVAESVVRVFP